VKDIAVAPGTGIDLEFESDGKGASFVAIF